MRDSRIVFRELVESAGIIVDEKLADLLASEDPWWEVESYLGGRLFERILSSSHLLRAVAGSRIEREEAEELARVRKRMRGHEPSDRVSSTLGREGSETWSPEDAREIEDVASGKTTSLLGKKGIPSRIGPFLIERVLGGGGMGKVYRGKDPDLDRPVAVKVIRPEKADHDFILRFRTEAKTLARFNHPNIVQVYRFGEAGESPYIAMQYVEGRSLSQILDEEKPSVERIVRLLLPVCEAVEYAHQHGVVHRDLKPENILVDETGHPFVFDFGLAKIRRSDTDLTASIVVGTPGYIAPEQADLGKVDAQSDVYSLGAILYRALTGKAPYEADSIYQYFLRLATERPEPPEKANPDVPPALSKIVMRAIDKDKNRRYRTAGELARALAGHLAGEARVSTESMAAVTPMEFVWDRNHPEATVAIALFERSDYNVYRELIAQRLVEEFGWDGTDKLRALMVLDELAGNAFEHGCRGRGEARVRIRLAANVERGRIAIEVSDQGDGFDLGRILAAAAERQRETGARGRGLPFVRRVSQYLATDSKGSTVKAEVAKTASHDYAGVVAPPADPTREVRTVAWKGHIDNFNYSEFEEALTRVLRAGVARIVCDLRAVTYICSSGMGALFAIAEQAVQKGGGMAVVVTSPEVRESLELFGLGMTVAISDSPQAAAAALAARIG
ncbi:MAG: protein kinase [Planctomycetes bacterium]|nr:protein kinase [Planctomycetota bacterium]